MIKFGSFYFAADQIAAIKRDKSADAQFPERLILSLKDGNSYLLNFKSIEAVEREMRNIAHQVETEQAKRLDKIENDISLAIWYLRQLDKRQLRILRILRKLPGTNAEEIDAALEG